MIACAFVLLALAADASAATRTPHHGKRHAKHVPSCRAIHRRLAKHLPLRTHRGRVKAKQCRRARRRAHHRAVLRHRAQVRKQAAHQPASAPVAPPPAQTASAPAARGSARGWNGFGAGAWPAADWRPYASSSPFNQPIPANPTVHPRSAQIVRTILSWEEVASLKAGAAGSSSDYGHPTYWAQPNDPIYTLKSSYASPAIDGRRIAVPSEAQPAGGGDGHMTIVEPDGWEYDLWQAQSKPAGGGTLRFGLGGRTRIDGSGLKSAGTASNFGNLAGVIRAQELAAGHIDHALFVVLKCTSGDTSFGYGTNPGPDDQAAFVYPASHGGGACSSADDASTPPMGARLQLAMSDAQIAALNVPAWKKTILTALAHYGGYVGDTGGPGFGL
ncbi:MAG TPA: hypothetical protein VE972_06905, partial [Conexibacter sp.]|nr:hypothetical protein [Conexibacter sp.]